MEFRLVDVSEQYLAQTHGWPHLAAGTIHFATQRFTPSEGVAFRVYHLDPHLDDGESRERLGRWYVVAEEGGMGFRIAWGKANRALSEPLPRLTLVEAVRDDLIAEAEGQERLAASCQDNPVWATDLPKPEWYLRIARVARELAAGLVVA